MAEDVRQNFIERQKKSLMRVLKIIAEETTKQVLLLHTAWEEIFLKIQK